MSITPDTFVECRIPDEQLPCDAVWGLPLPLLSLGADVGNRAQIPFYARDDDAGLLLPTMGMRADRQDETGQLRCSRISRLSHDAHGQVAARRNGHDVYARLHDVMAWLPTKPANGVAELLPQHWPPARQDGCPSATVVTMPCLFKWQRTVGIGDAGAHADGGSTAVPAAGTA